MFSMNQIEAKVQIIHVILANSMSVCQCCYYEHEVVNWIDKRYFILIRCFIVEKQKHLK